MKFKDMASSRDTSTKSGAFNKAVDNGASKRMIDKAKEYAKRADSVSFDPSKGKSNKDNQALRAHYRTYDIKD